VEIGFVGAGKLGFSLGKYFSQNQLAVTGYFSKSPEHAQNAACFTETEAFSSLEALCACSDALFLTVPDGQIGPVWDQLRMLPIQNKLICHCSGCLSSQVFTGIESTGAYGYSVHPLYAVNDRYASYHELSKVCFTLEGSFHCLDALCNLLTSLGNPVQILDEGSKAMYHAAAVFASNLVLAPLEQAVQLLTRCGFDEQGARKALAPLILGNAENFCRGGGPRALTGPLERGDSKTIRKHQAALTEEEWALYAALTKRLLPLAAQKHRERDYGSIKQLLNGEIS